MAREIRATIPVVDASQSFDTETKCYVLEDWFVHQLIGYASALAEADAFWSGDFEEILDAQAAVQEQIIQLMNGTCLDNLMFRLNQGHLEYSTDGGETWVDVGDVTGPPGADGDTILQGGYAGLADNAVPLPYSADGADRYCLAAQMLAREYSDFAQDCLELAIIAVQESAGVFQITLAALLDFLPVGEDTATELLEFATETTVLLLETARDGMADPDAIDLAAAQLLCALQATYPAWDDTFDYVSFPSLLPLFAFTPSLTPDPFAVITNFDETMDWMEEFLSGAAWGYGILNFGRLVQGVAEIIPDAANPLFTGYLGRLNTIVPQIMAMAEFFDSRDCAAYDPCEWTYEILIGTTNGQTAEYDIVWGQHNTIHVSTVAHDAGQSLQLAIALPGETTVTAILITDQGDLNGNAVRMDV